MGVLAYTVASAAQGDLGLVLTAGRGSGGVLGGVENPWGWGRGVGCRTVSILESALSLNFATCYKGGVQLIKMEI